jgi:hypothetical protein
MFTKSQLNNMNYDMRFSSSPWIKIIENKNTNKDDYDLYKLYPTNNYSVSTGREYIAVPIDKTFSSAELLKYNIDK